MSDPYTISRKEGWRRWVDAPPRVRPELLSCKALAGLGAAAREDYDEARHDWHANFGTLRTPQLEAVHDELDLIVATNRQDPDRVRGAAVLDSFSGLGKTTTVNAFLRDFDRKQRRRFGERAGEHEHLPVFRIGLTSNTTLRTFNHLICEFYGHPATNRSTAARLASYAVDLVLSCHTKVGYVDDLHFVNMRHADGVAVANHLKWLANELPITFVFAGVGLAKRGFFSEGLSGEDLEMAQTARRWTRLEMPPFTIDTEAGKRHWHNLLCSTEQQLVLADAHPGMLSGIGDYLFARTTGHIGSFKTLIERGCVKAIRAGTERLDIELLDAVRIDQASEDARRELAASFNAGTLTTARRGR